MTTTTKTGRMCWGVGVDGVSFFTTVTLDQNEEICRECDGQGSIYFDYGRDGFEKLVKERCETCRGEGTITTETEEE